MANGRASDTQFRYQRPAAGIYRVGPSGSKMLYTSIQSAINAAVADGFTSSLTPATVEIYPGTYVEDVTLAPGVHLRGVGCGIRTTNEVEIDGTVTYSPVAGTINDNVVNIDTIAIHPTTASKKALIFSGTAPARINMRKSVVQSASAVGGTTGLITVSNSGSQSTCRFTDCTVQATLTTDTELLQLTAATTEFYGGQGGLNNQSGGTIATGVSVAGTATLNLRMPAFVSGAFTQIITLSASTAVISVDKCILQNTLAGGHIFNATATGTIRCRHAGLFTANLAGKICNASAAVNLDIHNCDFANGGSQALPFAQIDPIVLSRGNGTYNMESDQVYKEYQVGRGIGFQTIQAAINAASSSGPGIRKVIRIPQGTYIENLTLVGGIDLVADTFDNVIPMSNIPSVQIQGNHTFVANGNSVNCKGILFSTVFPGSATTMFALSGSGSQNLRFERCQFIKSFAGAASMFVVTSTSAGSITLDDCALNMSVDSGSVCDFSGAVAGWAFAINGQVAQATFPTPSLVINGGTSTPTLLYKGSPSGSILTVNNCVIQATTPRLIEIASSADYVRLDHASIQQNFNFVQEGELIKLSANVFSLYVDECFIDQVVGPSPNGLPCLARDSGTQASGTITIASNPSAGDTVTINGTVFTARVVPTAADEFAIGATTTDTATNLRKAINISSNIGNDSTSGVRALIYATSAVNVVTVKSFGDAAGNAYTLASSVPLVMVPSGATLAGGVDGSGGTVQIGSNSFHGQMGEVPIGGGGCVVALPMSGNQYANSTINQPERDEIVIQLEGVDQALTGFLPGTKWLNFAGNGVDVTVDLTNNARATVTIPGTAQANEFVVGPGKGQYATIQDALDAADADMAAGRKVVVVTPGQYTENLSLYGGVDLVASSFDFAYQNGAPVEIIGNHVLTPTANGEYVQVSNIMFNNFATSGSVFEIAASAFNQNQIIFEKCYFNKAVNEATPMFLISNVNFGTKLIFMGCAAACQTDSGVMFDVGVGEVTWQNPMYDSVFAYDLRLSPSTLVTSGANLATLGAAGLFQVIRAKVSVNADTAIDLQDSTSVARILDTEFLQSSDDGCLLRYSGAGQSQLVFPRINLLSGSGNSVLVARDSGVQASGSITIDTQPVNNDTVTINGVVFTAKAAAPVGDEFLIGATVNDTADNLRNAINGSGTVGIFKVVYARTTTNVVTITARKSGVAGNAITLASSVPLVMIPSGANLTGGTAGVGGTFVYSTLAMEGVNDIQSTITLTAYASGVAAV